MSLSLSLSLKKKTFGDVASAANNAHLQVVILDNDLGILERMQDGVHSSTAGASARSWLASSQALPALKVALDDECSGKGLAFTKN